MKGGILDPSDDRLEYLLSFGNMCLKMISSGKLRIKQLTKDTAQSLYQTCFGLVELARYLL